MVRRLLYLNGIAILFVIFFHAAGWGFTAMFAWTPRYLPVSAPVYDQVGSLAYYWLRLVEQIVVVAIPAFLFVSGYFMAFSAGRRDNVTWKQIWGRVKMLLFPYIFWTLLMWAAKLAQGEIFPLTGYAIMFFTGRTTPAYYYVPLLIQYYLLSPFIIPFARNKWVILLIITGIIQFSLQLSQMLVLLNGLQGVPDFVRWLALVPKWFFLARLFWFVLGVVIGFHIKEFKQFLARFKWIFLVTAVVCIPLGVMEWEAIIRFSGQDWLEHRETILDSIYSLAFIFAFFAFTDVALPLNKQVSDLGVKSFGIYLAHIPAMEFTARGIYLLIPALLGVQLLFQPIMVVFGLGIPLLMMAVVNRSPARRYYSYIFG